MPTPDSPFRVTIGYDALADGIRLFNNGAPVADLPVAAPNTAGSVFKDFPSGLPAVPGLYLFEAEAYNELGTGPRTAPNAWVTGLPGGCTLTIGPIPPA